MSEQKNLPYKSLGARLKVIREKCHESVNDVSGALEIEAEILEQIECGSIRPSEDMLGLLITHLAVTDIEANKLLLLAGYNQNDNDTPSLDDGLIRQMVMLMPMDTRIVYTDTVHVAVNNYGVVINFMQNNGMGHQQLAVARVGMSLEHAESVLQVLKQTLEQSKKPNNIPKSLPAPKHDQNHKRDPASGDS